MWVRASTNLAHAMKVSKLRRLGEAVLGLLLFVPLALSASHIRAGLASALVCLAILSGFVYADEPFEGRPLGQTPIPQGRMPDTTTPSPAQVDRSVDATVLPQIDSSVDATLPNTPLDPRNDTAPEERRAGDLDRRQDEAVDHSYGQRGERAVGRTRD